MKLVETGAIDLDEPVSRYLSRWQLPETECDNEGVTMRRLLSHTVGLSLHGYPGFHPDEPLPTLEESLSGATDGAGAVYLVREPGSEWEYSGGGYTLAQLIIEEITGQPFAEYMSLHHQDGGQLFTGSAPGCCTRRPSSQKPALHGLFAASGSSTTETV